MRILRRGAVLAAAASMLAAWTLAAEAVKGPCVAFPSGTTSGSAVVWWEAQAAGEGWVKYDAGGGQKLAKCGMPGPRHEVTIPGLKPGSTVRYEIGGSGVSDSGSFRVPDPKQTKMRFAVIGDPRAWDKAAKAMLPLLTADAPELLIATGDYVHKGKGTEAEANWNQCFQTMRPLLKCTVFMPSVGDHEYGGDKAVEAYRANFVLPGNERWFSYDWGNCHFLSLDVNWEDNLQPGTEQYSWIEKDLQSVAGKRDLIVAYFHLPVATCGNYAKDPDNTVRGRRLLPLFQKYGVGLVFCGHDHNYQRWDMGGGVTHILTGGFTVERLYDINQEAMEKAKGEGLKAALKAPHYVLVDVDGKAVKVTVLGEGRKEIDSFSFGGAK